MFRTSLTSTVHWTRPKQAAFAPSADFHFVTATTCCMPLLLCCSIIIIIMEICKAPTLRLKALNKHTHIMYIEMEKVIYIYIDKGF